MARDAWTVGRCALWSFAAVFAAGCLRQGGSGGGADDDRLVVAIDSLTPDGVYGAGAMVVVTVEFREPVTVDVTTGTPRLLFDSGGQGVYQTGSGTTLWTFRYFVAAPDRSDDLDARNTDALQLNGAVASLASNAVIDLRVPVGATAGSLATNRNLVIRTDPIDRPFDDGPSWQTYDPSRYGVGLCPQGFLGASFDGRYLYFAPADPGAFGEVVRFDATLSPADRAAWDSFDPSANSIGTLPRGYSGCVSDGRYVYFAPYSNSGGFHGEVLRYDSNGPFANAASWSAFTPGGNGVGADPVGYSGVVFDGRYVYFVPEQRSSGFHCEVLRYDTFASFSSSSSWVSFDPSGNGVGTDAVGFRGAVFTGDHVYFVPFERGTGHHGEVLRYDVRLPFAQPASWAAFDPSANGVGADPTGYSGAAFDGRYVYFSPFERDTGFHAEVLRYDTRGGFSSSTSWATFDVSAGLSAPAARGYSGAAFDGRYLYLAPMQNDNGVQQQLLRCDLSVGFANASAWTVHDPATDNLGWSLGGYGGAVLAAGGIWYVPLDGDGGSGEVLRFGAPLGINRAYGEPHPGTLHAGQPIRVKVQFPVVVDVDVSSGTPYLEMANGARAYYRGGSGTSNLDFLYLPMAHEVATDLDYASDSALVANGATLRNGGIDVVRTLPAPAAAGSLGASNQVDVLTTPVVATFDDRWSWESFDLASNSIGTQHGGCQGIVYDGRHLTFVPFGANGGAVRHGEAIEHDTRADFATAGSWSAFDAGANAIGVDPDGYRGGCYDGRYVYFAPLHNGSGYHGEVLRRDTRLPFTDPTAWTVFDPSTNGLGSGAIGFSGCIFDGRYVLFAPYGHMTSANAVLRYDTLQDFGSAASWSTFVPSNNGAATKSGYDGIVFDGRFAYFVPHAAAGIGYMGEMLRYDTRASFTASGSWQSVHPLLLGVGGAGIGFTGAVFDGRYVYFVPGTTGAFFHGEVMRYDTTGSFTVAGSWSAYDAGAHGVGLSPAGFAGALFDGRYVYFAPFQRNSGYHGEVLRLDTHGTFASAGAWQAFDPGAAGLGSDMVGFFGCAYDGERLFFAPSRDATGQHGRVMVLGN